MKRKASSEQFTNEFTFKEHLTKHRSPNFKKAKSKSKLEQISMMAVAKGKPTRAKEEHRQHESKGDSNNSSTNCTFSRPKTTKPGRKAKEREELLPKRIDEKIGQQQIMNIINNFANKIQRQWKVHAFRQKFKAFIVDMRSAKSKSLEAKRPPLKNNCIAKLYFDEKQIKHLNYVEDEPPEENTTEYNHRKYEKESSSSSLSKEISVLDPASQRSKKTEENQLRQSFNLVELPSSQSLDSSKSKIAQKGKSGSLPSDNRVSSKLASTKEIRGLEAYKFQESSQPVFAKMEVKKVQGEDRRCSYDSCKPNLPSNFQQNRRHSTGELDILPPKRELKALQIDKVLQIKIERKEEQLKSGPNTKTEQKRRENNIRDREASSRQIKHIDNDKNAFNARFPLDKVLRKCKKALQVTKFKKLLSIENRYNRNELTYRSYLEIVNKINEQHHSKLQLFKEREGQIKSNLNDLLNIYKINLKSNSKYIEDQQDHHQTQSNLEVSMSFDRWDFNSSAKKSIDSHLDFTENAWQTSKVLSIESVLRELEQEDHEREEGDRKFKKNKSLQVIEAIAQRSKEISENEVQSFHQSPEQEESFDVKIRRDSIKIQEIAEISEDREEKEDHLFTPKLESYDPFNQVDEDNIKQSQEAILLQQPKQQLQSQAKSKAQSLLVSQIDLLSPNGCQSIERSPLNTDQKVILKDLIFKDFKSLQGKDITVRGLFQKEKPSNEETKQEQFQEKKRAGIASDPKMRKFVDLVNEKIVLNNIKMINSIKFMFAKLGDEKKNQKINKAIANARCIPIETDINAINTWLLEISHFILDHYQQVVKDNLINIKQPPSLELLEHSKRNQSFSKPYEAIPEHVFKDFEFIYIKSLAKNASITPDKYDIFSTLVYTFHRSLVDSLNISLTEQLISGKQWLRLPWKTEFRRKKKIEGEHTKVCLERSINMVSNWGQYGLGRLLFDDEITELQNKQYEQEKINLVCRQQVFEIGLSHTITEAHMLLKVSKAIFEQELALLERQLGFFK